MTSNWQPIETAPKGKVGILVWGGRLFWEGLSCPDGGCEHDHVSLVHWHDGEWESGAFVIQPTHWLPIPAPPTQNEEKA